MGILLVAGCVSTKKSKDEVGFVGKKYHDMTAKFNGYFNANELYEESVVMLEESYQDNFNQIIDIYPHESVEDPTMVEENMDKAIEKVIKVSSIHEVSKWVDDCYVLMGKSQYLKGDYESSQETFEYFVDDFNPKDPDSRVYVTPDRKGDAKARKKQKERERKIKEDEREQARKEKEKARKEEQKRRKKDRKNRDSRSRSSRSKETTDVAEESATTAPAEISGTASTTDDIALSEDEQYLRSIEQKTKKDKAEAENPFKTGLLQHRPAYYEGMLWLAKSYIKREKWLDANYYLNRIIEEGYATEEVMTEVPVTQADMYLKMKDYDSAVGALEEALEGKSDKRLKARLAFILAQIYDMKGQADKAYAAYERVGDYKPTFEMKLNSDVNQLKSSWAAGKITSESAVKKLNRMAKESKNEPYRGNIYFTQAEILLADGQESEAMSYFNKALEYSSGNNKKEIYYRLASLFLAKEDYTNAKNYYDSTLTLMQKKDERYLIANRYATNLKSIAQNLSIIELQDSLLRLANMDPEDLQALALEKAKESWEANQSKEEASTAPTNPLNTSVLSGNSRFFAYNQSALQKGRRDFRSRWGDRLLEDDWRRSSKSSSLIDNEVEEEVAEVEEEVDYSKEIEKFLRTIPREASQKEQAEMALEEAYFELGTGFRTYIENFKKSNETLETLLNKFPDTEHAVEAYYYLYLNYTDLNDSTKAQFYYNKIMSEYPDSPFAIYLKDPNNENALMTEEKKIQLYYENTYEEFENGNYQVVLNRMNQGREEFGQEHKMAAKYDLLRAMAIGNVEGEKEYVNALRGVILKYNNTPEQTYAREMLRFLKGDEEAFGEEVSQEDLNQFKIEDDKLHYVIVLLYGGNGNTVNNAKISINKFSDDNFKDWRLRSTSMYLNQENKTHLILIRRFQDKTQAMEYFDEYEANKEKFLNTGEFSYDVFAINQINYREVITKKSANAYRKFFDQHYRSKDKK